MASELRYMLGGLSEDIANLNWKASPHHTIETAEQGEIVRY